MFEIDYHKVQGKGAGKDTTRVLVMDEAGQGGAHHVYEVRDGLDNAEGVPTGGALLLDVKFQDGPIQDAGVNGVQQEHLLAVIQHRLECFQAGPFANVHNAEALEHVKLAMAALHARTTDRIVRQVEGRNEA